MKKNDRRILSSAVVLGGLVALGAVAPSRALAGDAATTAPSAPTPTSDEMTCVVKRRDLRIAVACDGHVESAQRTKVRYITQAFGDAVRVVAVSDEARHGRRVDPGALLVTLDRSRFDDAIRSAKESRDDAVRKLDEAVTDEKTSLDADRVRLERAEKSATDASRALDQFERIDGPKMLRQAELDVKNHEADVEDRQQELDQLEQMYKGTHLATETKEIVLTRARRSLERSSAYLDLSRTSELETRERAEPDQLASMRDQARWATAELESARVRIPIEEKRKQDEVVAARIALRAASERVVKLDADQVALEIKAPAAGIVTGVTLAPGDVVRPDDVIGEIADPSPVAHVEIAAADRLVLSPGSRVVVSFPEIPDRRIGGQVIEVSLVGRKTDKGTRFDATVSLSPSGVAAASIAVPLGIEARVEGEKTIRGAIVVARAAIVTRGAQCYCRLAPGNDGDTDLREVTLGEGDADEVAVISGLREGDSIVFRKAAAAAPASESPSKPEKPDAAPAKKPASAKPLGPLVESISPPASTAPAPSPAEAFERGVRYLIAHQNPDGSWGSFESSRVDEIMTGTIASFPAWQEATTALCALALQQPSRTDRSARAALEKAIDQLIEAPPTERATGDVFYDTWTHVYLVQALSTFSRDERFASKRTGIAATVTREIAILRAHQGADGGFGYYDFGYALKTPSGNESTSFLTAAAVIALDAAVEAGFQVDQEMIDDALACIERLRLPSGAYIYGTYAQMVPNALFNWVKGSLGRSQPCNLALWLHKKGVTEKDLVAGLDALETQHKFIAIGQGRPIPHEAWYYTAGYYYLFGHYYAARVAASLGGKTEADFASWLDKVLVDCQDDDGSWLDYPMYGYGRDYGTAFALLAMETCERR